MFNTRLQIEKLQARAVELLGLRHISYCYEVTPINNNDYDDELTQDWGTEDGRLIYSLAVAGVQFLLPLTGLALVHAREENQQNVLMTRVF